MPPIRKLLKYLAAVAALFDPVVAEPVETDVARKRSPLPAAGSPPHRPRPEDVPHSKRNESTAAESDRVVHEWGRVYAAHHDAFTIRRPERIARLSGRDLPRLLSDLCVGHPSVVLEAGCGSGQDSLFLASLGHRVTALDASPEAVEHLIHARDVYARARDRTVELDVRLGDLMKPPFPPATFDLVFNSGVVEHLSRDLRSRAVGSMAALTRPGGHVVLVVPNAGHPLGPIWSWLVDHGTDHSAVRSRRARRHGR